VRTQTTCYSGIIRSRHDDWTRDHYADLKAAGLYKAPPWEGGLLNISQWRRVANGAIWQLHTKLNDQAEEISALEAWTRDPQTGGVVSGTQEKKGLKGILGNMGNMLKRKKKEE